MIQALLIISIPFIIRAVVRFQKGGSFFPAWYLSSRNKAFLNSNFPFYQKLPAKSKKIFERRVAHFLASKTFIARKMDEVTWEMKVLISASAIQVTFGFPKVNLRFFSNILVFPDTFYSLSNHAYHKGEVNPGKKAIVLSWKAFLEGYLQKDGRNLGLHEMAHALRLENKVMNGEYNFLNKKVLTEWEERARKTMAEINSGNETFFRDYGGLNNEEFFAVAVENFFERPLIFKQKHPLIYQTLCRLLHQDPTLLEKA